MAFTVTATQSGASASRGVYLQVKVLTGAVEAGGASQGANSLTGATAQGSITPSFTNSLICFALSQDSGSVGMPAAAASNTYYNNVNDATDGWSTVQGFYSGAVTATTPVTYGAGSASGDHTNWCAYEVHPTAGGGTPAVNASSPVLASTEAAAAVTTASFTPPGGTVLVAMITAGGTGSGAGITMTVTDTSGMSLVWTQRITSASSDNFQPTWVFTTTIPAATPVVPATRPGRTWLTLFRRPGFFSQLLVPPVTTTAAAGGAVATASALNATVVTASAAAAPTFNPGRTWRKHFQWPQQQQLSGPPPLAFANAGLASATGTAFGANGKFIAGVAGTGTGKYLTDAFGNPIMVKADSVWGLPMTAGQNGGATTYQSDIDSYTATRAAQGFNAFIAVAAADSHYTGGFTNINGSTWDGVAPFTGGGLSVLNAPYWARIDYMLSSAEAAGHTVFLAISPTHALDDPGSPLFNQSSTEWGNYGTLLGNRYKNRPNLVWFFGDDYEGAATGDYDTLFNALLTGIRNTGDTHLVTIENYEQSTARFDIFNNTVLPWGTANASFQFIYDFNASYIGVNYAYAEASPLAVMHGDGTYDDSTGNRVFWRNFAWWNLSSGSRGFIYGRDALDLWFSTSLAVLATNTVDNSDLGAYWSIFGSFTGWHKLVPDLNSSFVTAGRGSQVSAINSGSAHGVYTSGNFYVTASVTADGSLAVVYIPDAGGTITVSPARLGAGYTATWVDPISGAQSPAGIAATYTHPSVNSVGSADWLLVFQGPPVVPPTVAPALPGRTWLNHFRHPQQFVPPAPAVAAFVNAPAGLASATGTALGQDTGADLAMVSPNAGLATGTGAALDATGSLATNGGTASATGSGLSPGPSIAIGAAVATATGAALGQDNGNDLASVTVNAGLASGVGTALGASTSLPALPVPVAYPGPVWRRFFQHRQQPAPVGFTPPPATNAPAGLASATGTALGQDTGADLASVAPNAGNAAATGTGQSATDSLATNGGTASATGSGQNPGPAIAIGASTAAGTGAALDATVNILGAPPLMQILPGRTWLRQFRHLQQPLPPPPFVAPTFQIARSTAVVTDPRDGTPTVAALATSAPSVS